MNWSRSLAYCQKFQSCQCQSEQTYMEFARNNKQLFNGWRTPEKIDKT